MSMFTSFRDCEIIGAIDSYGKYDTSMYAIFKFGEYGFSMYRGVRIIWDEDYDQRIFAFVNKYKKLSNNTSLHSVYEHEGSIDIIVKNISGDISSVPESFEIVGDEWAVNSVKVFQSE